MAITTLAVKSAKFHRHMAVVYYHRIKRTALQIEKGWQPVRKFDLPKELRTPAFFKSLVVELVSNPQLCVTPKKFAVLFKVDEDQAIRWWYDPKVCKVVAKRLKEQLGTGQILAPIYRKMWRQAKRGSFKHQRLILEIVGHYTPGLKLDHDMTSMEQRFQELEQRRLAKTNAIDVESHPVNEPE